jgi:hypothetical protein
MRKFKLFLVTLLVAMTAITFSSCHGVKVGADEEAVLVMQPWFFGQGGVYPKPVNTGLEWCAATTYEVIFKVTPIRYDESFNDIFSNDNTPLDFNTYIVIEIEKGKTPILLQNYGENWYKNNIQVPYRNKTREFVSTYSPFDLISNRDVLSEIDVKVLEYMKQHIIELSKVKELPIKVISVTTGAAKPNEDQLAEMNQTAAAIQKTKTQERLKEMETVREEAEKQRAKADKAYMREMNLTADQYIQLRAWSIIEQKNDANIDVLFDGSTQHMWNIRR